jgi:hypothetical protein
MRLIICLSLCLYSYVCVANTKFDSAQDEPKVLLLTSGLHVAVNCLPVSVSVLVFICKYVCLGTRGQTQSRTTLRMSQEFFFNRPIYLSI